MWRDLSSSELRRRLIQRGCTPFVALAAVARRDHPDGAAIIDQWLGRA